MPPWIPGAPIKKTSDALGTVATGAADAPADWANAFIVPGEQSNTGWFSPIDTAKTKTTDLLFENPGELPGREPGSDSVDLPLGALRDPLNTDPGLPGPSGGADVSVADKVGNAIPDVPDDPLAGAKKWAIVAILVAAVFVFGEELITATGRVAD